MPKGDGRSYQERFWPRVLKTDSCWLWLAGCNGKGYGYFWIDGRTIQAYKVADDWARGPLPAGYERHHVCENRLCVRPSAGHVERWLKSTHRRMSDNPWGKNARKTHCPRGHYYTGRNKNGSRICAHCQRLSREAFLARRNAIAL